MSRNIQAGLWLTLGVAAWLWLFTNVAFAHTDAELDAWHDSWHERLLHAATTGSRDLTQEWTDMVRRHPCQLGGNCVVVDKPARRSVDVRNDSVPLAPDAIRSLVETYFPAEWVDEALSVSYCESRWNPGAKNPKSTASGLFQFLAKTWERYGRGDVFDPEANVAAAARMTQRYVELGHWRWLGWTCQP